MDVELTLRGTITWLVSGGGIGTLLSRAVEWLDGVWPWLHNLRADIKRAVVFGMIGAAAAAIGAALLLLAAWMGYEPLPETAQAWVERLFSLAASAVLGSQLYHGAKKRAGH